MERPTVWKDAETTSSEAGIKTTSTMGKIPEYVRRTNGKVVAKSRILLGIIDRGNPDGKVPRDKWRWVKAALASKCFDLLFREPGPPLVCKDTGGSRAV